MNNFEKAPLNVNATLMATAIKLNALIDTLSGDQLEKYNQLIQEQKERASKYLAEVLTPEELEKFKNLLG